MAFNIRMGLRRWRNPRMILSNNANCKIWYDAGNIIYCTGRDPLAEREPNARHVFALSASNGERVGVRCRDFGFNRAIIVEGVKAGATAEETTANARAYREFLVKVLAVIRGELVESNALTVSDLCSPTEQNVHTLA